MSQGVPNQGPAPTSDATHIDNEPLYTSPPEERNPSMQRPPPQQQATSSFGAPPMGEPSEPSAHPDNQTAATHTLGTDSPNAMEAPLNRSQSSVPAAALGGSNLHRHASGAYDTSTTSKADRGLFNGAAPQNTTAPGAFQQQTASQPGGTPVGVQPGSPYVQTQEVPSTGTSPMNMLVGNFNKYMTKAEGLAGNIWTHMKTGPSVTDTARGRMSQGIKLVQGGGFEGMYKSTFGMSEGEQLRKTYACYLSTSTGPVAGTLYISNLQFAFCSDRPLSYAPTPGQQAWSYYKMVLPLAKVKEVAPSFNENKPQEKYIQVMTQDGHDFWFMGFVNYDKGVKNMQLALQHIGEIDPNGGLKAPWAGLSVPGMSKRTGGQQSPTDAQQSPTGAQQSPTGAQQYPTGGQQYPTGGQQSPTSQQAGHIPTNGGPSPNYPTARAPNSTSANPQPTV